jgi:hypothetical protein
VTNKSACKMAYSGACKAQHDIGSSTIDQYNNFYRVPRKIEVYA